MNGPLPQIADKYDVLGQLGESGRVEVYKVHHRFLDEVRLLKIIQSPVAISEAASEGHLREARRVMRLRHPNIAQLYDFSLDAAGYASLFAEYLEGLTLKEALAELGRPPLGLTLEIAQQALRAVAYLHRSGMTHGGVSPDRLCLTRDLDGQPLVKWIDLGVARILAAGALPMAGLFLDQPRYAAPEQFGDGGRREPDARSDLYSFGVVLYELLTGRCPIAGHDPFSYMAGHLSEPPLSFAESDPEGALPEELRQAVLRALAKDPAERVRSADDLARRLAAIPVQGPGSDDYLDRVLARARERAVASLRPVVLPPRPVPQSILAPLPPPSEEPAAPRPVEPWTQPILLGREAVLAPAVPPVSAASPSAAAPLPLRPETRRSPPAPPTQEVAWDQRRLGYSPPQQRSDPELPALDRVAAAPLVSILPAVPAPGAPGGRERRRLAWGVGFLLIILLGGAAGWSLRRWSSSAGPAAAFPPAATPAAPPPAAAPRTVEVASASATPTPGGSERPPLGTDVREARKRRARDSTAELQVAEDAARRPERRSAPKTAGPAAAEIPFQRGDLIPAGPGIEYPEPMTPVIVAYPEAARGSGKRAKVRVALLVDENGNVVQARVQEGDHGGLGFNEAALEAAKRVHFLPATKNGIPGKFWTDLIYEFEPPPTSP